MTRDKSWMDRERNSVEWQTGMKDFLNFAFDGAHPDSTVPCPCRRCLNSVPKKKKDVHTDLLFNGMDHTYTHWIYHGEQSDEGSMSEDSDNEDAVDDGAGVCDMLNTLIKGANMEAMQTLVKVRETFMWMLPAVMKGTRSQMQQPRSSSNY